MTEKDKGKNPDFIGVGVQRSGTSWLYECLREHNEVFLPQKEVHFFNKKFEKGIDWYRSLFTIKDDSLVSGEFTPDYLFDPKVMENIAEYCPKAKLIIILRDPFDRAFSAYKLFKAHGKYEGMSFEEVTDKHQWIIEQSLYHNQLVKAFSLFERDQIKIYDFEDISYRPLWLLKDMYGFLGVNDEFTPTKFDEKYNVSGMPGLQNIFNLPAIQRSLNQSKIGRKILGIKKFKAVRQFKSWLLERNTDPNPKETHCSPELRQRFKKDVIETSKLLNKNYEKWY